MASCPFIEDPVDEEALIIQRAFRPPPAPSVSQGRTNPLAHTDSYLRERYRFSRQSIVYLCNLLEPHIMRVTRRSQALTTVQSVCIALRFFASGSFLYSVADVERLSFPNVLGCIDCTHVQIQAPPGPVEKDYVDRRSLHSLNVQMICDANHLITNIEAKWPGGVHDGRIFRACSLAQGLAQKEFEGVLLEDRGYPCLPYLLTPYTEPGTAAEEALNGALNTTRAQIEMVFGQLKSRFQCLTYVRVAPVTSHLPVPSSTTSPPSARRGCRKFC
ncbi:hypothetical protein GJAV_G00086600 [Gymnothorax javanicus]|nr:hypothetical protein GJAV_G00086600 [Gymnothorax javanicus]